jgi:hypothetical protein
MAPLARQRGAWLALMLCVWACWGGVQAQSLITRPTTLAMGAGAQTAGSASATASWSANPSTDLVVDYRLYYGTAPATYTLGPIDVAAPATSVVVPNLTPGTTYYFALQARAAVLISALSTEVAYTVPLVVDPNCVAPLGADAIAIFPTALGLTGSGGANSRAHLDLQIGSPGSPLTHIAVQTSGANIDAGTDGTVDGTNLTAFGAIWFAIPSASGTYKLSVLATNAYGCTQSQATAFAVTVP